MPLLVAFLIALTIQSAALAQDNNRPSKQDVPPGRDLNKDVAVVLPLIKSCIYDNWHKTVTRPNTPAVKIQIRFKPDGTLDGAPKVVNPVATADFSRLATTGLRAVHNCVPLKNMPPETYYLWKEVVLHFASDKSAAEIRGDRYVAVGQFDRAIAEYTKAIKMAPRVAKFYNDRAWAYFKAGKAAQGLPDAKKALELDPHDARALDTRGSIFEALGRRDEAIADFRRALSLGANDGEVQASGREALKRLGSTP